MNSRSLKQITTLSVLLAAGGCGQESLAPELQALFDVKAYIQSNLDDLDGAVTALQSDAPVGCCRCGQDEGGLEASAHRV
jgi:hypothetical protein